MRRLLSIVLMMAVGLPLFASVLTLGQQARLPVCCRRGGTHHCMETAASASDQPVLRGACPVFPRALGTLQTGAWFDVTAPLTLSRPLAQPALAAEVEAGFRISSFRSRQKRGPPSYNS